MKKILGIAALVLAMALLAVKVLATDVTATVDVLESCGLTVVSGDPISFGSIGTGITSPSYTLLNIKNKGSVPTDPLVGGGFTVHGDVWSDGGTNTFSVGQTEVSDDGGSNWDALPLAASPLQIYGGVINNGVTENPYFRVTIPEGQAYASYSQPITFTSGC